VKTTVFFLTSWWKRHI